MNEAKPVMVLKILSVVSGRSNLMRIAALNEAIKEFNQEVNRWEIRQVLVHTGQRYDVNVSHSLFNDVDLPKPDIFLGVGPASHSVQTARIMERFENVVLNERPQVVLVVGDVNSTVACALVTKKITWLGPEGHFVPRLGHVEAGLRSFDRAMPEEINRIVTDCISNYLFTTEESANRNLLQDGVPSESIYFVGNVMIDTLLRHWTRAKSSEILQDLQLLRSSVLKPYALLTLHPSSVTDLAVFKKMLGSFLEISKRMPIIFPVHPRTMERIVDANLDDYFVDHYVNEPEPWDSRVRIRLIPPLGYLDFLQLMSNAKAVLTDCGGIQEQSTMMGVPCITLRERTERLITVHEGSNVLAGTDPDRIVQVFNTLSQSQRKVLKSPRYWDGQAGKRIVKVLLNDYFPGQFVMNSAWALEQEVKELVRTDSPPL